MKSTEGREVSSDGQLRYVNILDYLVVLAKHKKFITRFVGLSILVAVILLYLILPRWYKSTTTVMAPKQKNTLGLLSSLSRATSPLRSFGLGVGSDDLLQFQTILKSRRCMEAVIDRFNLVKVYSVANVQEAVKELESNIAIGPGKEDVSLDISVFDTDANRASEMANYFVETLNTIYLEMSTSEARSNREFLEQRYRQNLTELKNAEDSLKFFQQKFRVYSAPDQLKAAVEAAATLQSQIAMKEIELGILNKTTADDNSLRQRAVLELSEVRKQLDAMMHGTSDKQSAMQIFAPFERAPEIGIWYFRHLREVELQGKILELIVPLYEQARIEEQRNTPSVIVLDVAIPPDKPSKPRRLIITGIVGVGGLLLACILAFFFEFLERAKKPESGEDMAKVEVIRRELHVRRLFK